MKYFVAESDDKITQCLKLKWESPSRLWGLVAIDNIFRIVNIVPLYVDDTECFNSERFLLNRYYLFR